MTGLLGMMTEVRAPEHVTFTGLDQRTDTGRVLELSARYPVEWGVLFSPKRQGADPRYPAKAVIEDLQGKGLRLAAHLCGDARAALRLNAEDEADFRLRLEGFGRAQVNYVPNPEVWPELQKETGLPLGHLEAIHFSRALGLRVIVQHRTLTFPANPDLDYLFDKSGGRGESPKTWPRHADSQLRGFAGGLGPHNVAEQVAAMAPQGPYWIDMEGRVRNSADWLDLDAVESVLVQVYPQL